MSKTFLVWCPDLGSDREDGRHFEADDAETAAERWAKREDATSAEYWIVGGQPAAVCVECPDGSVQRLIVHGEAIPYYRATRSGAPA